MSYGRLLTTLILLSTLTSTVYAAIVTASTFDSGLEGWSGPDIRFASSIGNPPGSMEFQELYSANASYASAPVNFLGDWSLLDGKGFISYDHFMPNVTSWNQGYWGAGLEREIRLTGSGGAATWTGTIPAFYSGWTTILVPLESTAWTVDSGTWGGMLSNITAFELRVDHFNDMFGAERTQFDNITLSAVPIPAAMPLMSSALALLGFMSYRQRRVKA